MDGADHHVDQRLSRRLRDVYVQEQELPGALREKFQIRSCIFWREHRSVYLLEDEAGRRSIVKRADGEQREVLRREAKVLERTRFSFAPAFLSWTEEDGVGWLQREYIPGDTLWELVERDGSMDRVRAGALLGRLCEMTGQMHRCRPPLIHRDLKPQNIVLTPEGELFLIDLGTVREYREGALCDTELLGTRQTAAPEQYGYRQSDARTDIYALGVVYFYLLTGSMDLQREALYTGMPDDCRDVIETCTRLDPRERYADAAQLREAVETGGKEADAPSAVGKVAKAAGKRAKTVGASEKDVEVAVVGETAEVAAAGKTVRIAGKVAEIMEKTAEEHAGTPGGNRSRNRRIRAALLLAAVVLAALGVWLFSDRLPYHFRSELIGQAVRASLGKTEGEAVSRRELLQIDSLRICGSHILSEEEQHGQFGRIHWINGERTAGERGTVTDLSDCRYMKNLRTLILDRQEITDLGPLAGLPLETLSLCDNPIRDSQALSDIVTLETLYMEETDLRNPRVLSSLTKLRALGITNQEPLDLALLRATGLRELRVVMIEEESAELLQELPLWSLTLHSWSAALEEEIGRLGGLAELTIYGYQNSTLRPLLGLTGLKKLDLFGGNLQSLEGIGALSSLTNLGISQTEVQELAPIGELPQLTQLALDGTQIADFSALSGMKELRWLQCGEAQRQAIEEITGPFWFELECVSESEKE